MCSYWCKRYLSPKQAVSRTECMEKIWTGTRNGLAWIYIRLVAQPALPLVSVLVMRWGQRYQIQMCLLRTRMKDQSSGGPSDRASTSWLYSSPVHSATATRRVRVPPPIFQRLKTHNITLCPWQATHGHNPHYPLPTAHCPLGHGVMRPAKQGRHKKQGITRPNS